MFLSKNHVLTSEQEQQIIESCLDWMIIDTTKVATKAYSVQTLYEIGKNKIGFILNYNILLRMIIVNIYMLTRLLRGKF